MKYVRKPVVVNAIFWTGENMKEVQDVLEGHKIEFHVINDGTRLLYWNNHGSMRFTYPGNWVFEDTEGRLVFYGPEKFEHNFEAVGDYEIEVEEEADE